MSYLHPYFASIVPHWACYVDILPSPLVFYYHVDLNDVLLWCEECGLASTSPEEAIRHHGFSRAELGDRTRFFPATREQIDQKGWTPLVAHRPDAESSLPSTLRHPGCPVEDWPAVFFYHHLDHNLDVLYCPTCDRFWTTPDDVTQGVPGQSPSNLGVLSRFIPATDAQVERNGWGRLCIVLPG